MKKHKIDLSVLKVDSFVTASKEVKGGLQAIDEISDYESITVCPSVNYCPTITICPSENYCPV